MNASLELVEYNKSIVVENENFKFENSTDRSKRISNENKYKFEVEMIMRDLDKVIEQQSSFAFAYFNKALIIKTTFY